MAPAVGWVVRADFGVFYGDQSQEGGREEHFQEEEEHVQRP